MSKGNNNVFRIAMVVILVLIVVLQILTLTQIPTSSASPPSRLIEVAGMVIQIGIFGVLFLTLIPIRNNYAAQLLRDRYQMFFDSWKVEDEDAKQFKAKPHLFVAKKLMEENEDYKNYVQGLLADEDKDNRSIKDYLLIVQLYEYLAFAHTFNTNSEYSANHPRVSGWRESATASNLSRLILDFQKTRMVSLG